MSAGDGRGSGIAVTLAGAFLGCLLFVAGAVTARCAAPTPCRCPARVIPVDLHRRDLDKDQRAYLVARLAPKVKAEAKERRTGRPKKGQQKTPAKSGGTSGDSRDVLAKMAGVGHTVMDQVAGFPATCTLTRPEIARPGRSWRVDRDEPRRADQH